MDSEPHYETDGLAGAFAIAKCLLNLNKKVTLLFDLHSETYMREIIRDYFSNLNANVQLNLTSLFLETCSQGLSEDSLLKLKELSEKSDCIVSIERPSVTVTGQYLTMRAFDISHLSSPFDQYLFPLVGQTKKNLNQVLIYHFYLSLISIGDGGNEVGMGSVQKLVQEHINNGEKIAANTYCDHLLVTDTSNFGGYALVYCIIAEILKLKIQEKEDHEGLVHKLFPEYMQPILKDMRSINDFKEFLLTNHGIIIKQINMVKHSF